MQAERGFRLLSIAILTVAAIACVPGKGQQPSPQAKASATTLPKSPLVNSMEDDRLATEAAQEVEMINAGQFNPQLHQESAAPSAVN